MRINNVGPSEPKRNNTNHDDHEKKKNKSHRSALSYLKAVVNKVAAILLCQRKPSSKGPRSDAVMGINSSIDNSTGSSRSQMRSKFSDSSGSSVATNGQVGTVAFSIEEIYKATDNFSTANKLGEGSFGTVYKGKLKDGSFVAIKRAKKDMHEKRSFTEFKNEILTLSKIEHLNLVRLFGYLEHGDERIIVVEYIANGTLREHLDGTRGNKLEISERLDIAIDVAHAVTYLHMYMDLPIIHRDIKASNILITEKLRAKVADFGFARLAVEDPEATHISTQVKGTVGYLDPEYIKTNQLTEKSDVYSFGIVLVELITGRYPLEPTRPLKERVTAKWALQRLKEGAAVVAMDPRLRRSPASLMVVEKILKLARHCLAPQRPSRPSMKQCCEVLWGIRKDFRDMNLALAASSISHHSDKVDVRNAHRNMFGIEGDECYRFKSA
ncbi:Calmodulin-binding receptor-like cytoplasmic kinase 1 [Camellia lanceoleosa]|uniref:Calmodulin-binding receptor-like cytoplasmic kinase 1 n=1 Tax=Camellia lanceoleosa TaxID=1840588 RepID=A0ACC0HNF9_9ERIC|nr:Calmodulin-binding receptor-like cytoplasmic kinase 1 [Camellia lanceoleosa]